MSKEQFYDPQQIFSETDIHFEDIPVFAYKKTVREQFDSGRFSKEDLLTSWRDMRYIREFENMLLSVRTKKNFNGVEYMYTGPAHLYIGEEAAAVGEAFSLKPEDFVFGSHRSHGEVIAKGLSAIEKLPGDELLRRMEGIFDGRILKKKNTIRIEVTNLPANRISEMDRKGVNWRKFKKEYYDVRYGLTTYEKWDPMPSGLNSSVKILNTK